MLDKLAEEIDGGMIDGLVVRGVDPKDSEAMAESDADREKLRDKVGLIDAEPPELGREDIADRFEVEISVGMLYIEVEIPNELKEDGVGADKRVIEGSDVTPDDAGNPDESIVPGIDELAGKVGILADGVETLNRTDVGVVEGKDPIDVERETLETLETPGLLETLRTLETLNMLPDAAEE